MKYKVNDEVKVKKGRLTGYITDIFIQTNTKINGDGESTEVKITYKTSISQYTTYTEKELELIRPFSDKHIDSIIIDANLAQGNFEFLKKFSK